MPERNRTRFSWKGLTFQQFRKKFRVRPPGPITVIDLDGPLLRVVNAAPRGNRVVVTRISAEKLELAADADRADPLVVGAAIAKTLGRLRVRSGAVIMGVPRALVVLRNLTLPVIEDSQELASMVYFQVGKDLPFPSEEAAIDFSVRRQVKALAPPPPPEKPGEEPAEGEAEAVPPAPKLEVLVAAVKREEVEFYQQTAAAAGLKLTALGWLSYANARCLEACRASEGEKGIALVTLRPDEVGIDVIASQSLLFSRGAIIKLAPEPPHPAPGASVAAAMAPEPAPPVEAPAPSVPETFVEAVTIEVVRSLHSYGGMEPNNPVAKLVVAGVTGHEKAVVETLQSRLNTPCTLLDPASALELPKAAREHAAGSISALGLALGVTDPQGLPFDFLNPKKPAPPRNMRRVRLMMGTAAATAVMLLILGVQRHFINKRENEYKALKAELAEATKKRPIYRQMRIQASTAQNWMSDGRNWLEHYAYLSAILPPCEDIYLSSISISGPSTIRLAVQARSGDILAKLEKQLRAAGYAVKPLAITPGADRYGCSFRSNVELTLPDDLKVDLAKVRPPPRPADDASLDAVNKPGRKGAGS